MIRIADVRRCSGADWYEEEGSRFPQAVRLSLVHYGRCLYRVGNDKLIVEKGDVLLIPETVPYYGKSIPTVTHEQFAVFFHTDTTAADELPLLGIREIVKLRPVRFAQIAQRLKETFDCWKESAPYKEALCRGIVLEQLALLNREWDGRSRQDSRSELAELMKSFIHNHYREKVTKHELGMFIGKSPNHTAVLFRETTGQTISDYVHTARIRAAQSLLAQSQMTVEEIADYVGYGDVSYFYRIFKRKLGALPTLYMQPRSANKL
ncbi:helix-turn-helix transcriptional regulator [Paenibacillus thalictri]|uniref:AraC family transcriptional regulator n=1 Tax=Paenibacillus thalictri TaxID=2527873 RepID=A0A4Q9E145_9BACL|nr:AraC family transcriptional regulator [Paenibacillus thalictri]TBL81281.1 AraC family transcriptional regulator [Paenibacillus thalictri]